MSDKSKPRVDYHGPYLQLAAFCEKVLEEKDGVLSAIRMVDRFTIPKFEPETLSPTIPPHIVTLAICFKAGRAKGRHSILVRGRKPSEQEIKIPELDVFFEGDNRGANLLLNLEVPTDEEGIYWFDVFVGDHFITSLPLQVIFQVLRISPEPVNPTG